VEEDNDLAEKKAVTHIGVGNSVCHSNERKW